MNDVAVDHENPKATGTVGHSAIYKKGSQGIIRKLGQGKIKDANGNPVDGSSKFEIDMDGLNHVPNLNGYREKKNKHNALVQGELDPRFGPETLKLADNFILVRALMIENETKEGILKPAPSFSIPNSDDSGYIMNEVARSYPFTTVGRLVNASDSTLKYYSEIFNQEVKLGDYVMYDQAVVAEIPRQGTKTSYLPAAFLHPFEVHITNEDQMGYLLLRKFDVQALLSDKNMMNVE